MRFCRDEVRHGIETVSAERMAPHQTASRQVRSSDHTESSNRFRCVSGAGWCEPAGSSEETREQQLVTAEQEQRQALAGSQVVAPTRVSWHRGANGRPRVATPSGSLRRYR